RAVASLPGRPPDAPIGSGRPRLRRPGGPGVPSRRMERPSKFEHHRYIGDKRTQVVYDLDHTDEEVEAAGAELMEAETFICFAPDTLAEARNRRYRLAKASRRARREAGIEHDSADAACAAAGGAGCTGACSPTGAPAPR